MRLTGVVRQVSTGNILRSLPRPQHRGQVVRAHVLSYRVKPFALPRSRSQVWCLDAQIQHKVDFLRQHVLLPGRPPAVILAHSIGAYIMLHALQQLEQHPDLECAPADGGAGSAVSTVSMSSGEAACSDPNLPGAVTSNAGSDAAAAGGDVAPPRPPSVRKLVSMFPFFSADFTSGRQRFLRAAAHSWRALGFLASGVRKLPYGMQRRILQAFSRACFPHGDLSCVMRVRAAASNCWVDRWQHMSPLVGSASDASHGWAALQPTLRSMLWTLHYRC
jgi:hypothetical protein